ncbi:fasciclin domain-containing protein [Acuticoccus sp. I52.16.1]|uniref:fasciclin domain-containing protein n=1 Tax=Acuticoccus sp. I52.16.1 TaxID=2928472 RepID=UPI001FCFECE3|nr:fasciclin domain-containing protein [Acuticoccus sp. I52.16.1]UOM33043.1 fasciclin domain-containing protein [Acuticoccus sp. I52.16.1]
MSLKAKFIGGLAAVAIGGCAMTAQAQTIPKVGGAPMYPDKPIAQNASQAPNLTTLVAAVKAAGLVDTLAGPGPFTVFAPTNAAFEALPPGTVETLLKPENRDKLTAILTYHVVPGTMSAGDLASQAGRSPDDLANLSTVEGGPVSVKGTRIYDESGHMHRIVQTDVFQSNGVVHVIDGVLLPK